MSAPIRITFQPNGVYTRDMSTCDICGEPFRWKDECVWGRGELADSSGVDVCRRCYALGAHGAWMQLGGRLDVEGRELSRRGPVHDDGSPGAARAIAGRWHDEAHRRHSQRLFAARFVFTPEPHTPEYNRIIETEFGGVPFMPPLPAPGR
jgi:hypothetical protein